jgi:hypothetical protein
MQEKDETARQHPPLRPESPPPARQHLREQAEPEAPPELTEEEAAKLERERDAKLPLAERRPEYLTGDERVEQAEEIFRQAPHGYSPTEKLGD